jgi:hypothetical protein
LFCAVRRKWFDLYEVHASPLAKEALERIGQLYCIEKAIRGRSAEERLAQRQQYAVPLLVALRAWTIEQSAKCEKGSTFATAFNYAFNIWDALQRYTEDGRLEIDNNIAERAGVERNGRLYSLLSAPLFYPCFTRNPHPRLTRRAARTRMKVNNEVLPQC